MVDRGEADHDQDQGILEEDRDQDTEDPGQDLDVQGQEGVLDQGHTLSTQEG